MQAKQAIVRDFIRNSILSWNYRPYYNLCNVLM